MKKLTLSTLSREAMDRTQENLITGGGLSGCVCAHICASCGCISRTYLLEAYYNFQSQDEANVEGDEVVS